MKALEEENRRLKRMYADLSRQANLLKEARRKNHMVISWTGKCLHICRKAQRLELAEKAVAHRVSMPDVRSERDLL